MFFKVSCNTASRQLDNICCDFQFQCDFGNEINIIRVKCCQACETNHLNNFTTCHEVRLCQISVTWKAYKCHVVDSTFQVKVNLSIFVGISYYIARQILRYHVVKDKCKPSTGWCCFVEICYLHWKSVTRPKICLYIVVVMSYLLLLRNDDASCMALQDHHDIDMIRVILSAMNFAQIVSCKVKVGINSSSFGTLCIHMRHISV